MPAYRTTGTGLLIPEEPKIACSICGTEYPVKAQGSFQRHVEECYRENEEALQTEIVERETPILDHDTEREEWTRRRGKYDGEA